MRQMRLERLNEKSLDRAINSNHAKFILMSRAPALAIFIDTAAQSGVLRKLRLHLKWMA